MGLRGRLKDKLKRKESELREFEGKARDLRNYIQGLRDTLNMLPKDDSKMDSDSVILRRNGGPALAQEYLRRAGSPQHISDILVNIGKEVNRKNRTALAGALGSYARKDIIFKAEGSNVFGLIGMRMEQTGSLEPPRNFGLMNDPDERMK